MTRRPLRFVAQSAMEYLMTYGWAILIIAVVLAALFELGVFNGSNLAPQACIAQAGFVCKNPIYTANGIGITFGQTAGRDYYGDWIFVASQGEALNQNGIPINFTCTATGCANAVPVGVLVPGQIVGVDFNASKFAYGQIPANAPIGTPFAGYVWLGYCLSPCSVPTAYSKVATITAKEAGTSSASFGGYFGGGSGSSSPPPAPPPSGPQVGNVVFTADPLPTGTTWSVTYNGVMESNTIPGNIVFTGIPTSASLPYTVNSPLVGSSACYSTSDASGTAGVGIVNIPFSQVPCYVNITLSAGGSAPTGFQQMLQFNPSSYTSYEASDLGNLRFYQGNSELYSWCESNCTSGSSLATFWVKTNGLVSGTNANVITMYFEPLSGTMAQYSGPSGHAGEAPQLSSPYGQYDNGASVFNFYDNFAGTSLSSKWGNTGAYSFSVNNMLDITGGSCNNIGLYSTTSFTDPYIIDAEANYATNDDMGIWWNIQTSGSTSSNTNLWAIRGTSNGYDDLYTGNPAPNSFTQYSQSNPTGDGSWHVYTLISGSNNNPAITQKDYSTYIDETNFPSSYTSGYIGPRYCGGSYAEYYWIRVRAYPPNGVMPSATFGTVQ